MGDGGNQNGIDVAFHNSPISLVATGQYLGSIDLGGGTLASAGSADIYLAEYDANGNHLWSRSFGGASADYPRGVSVDLYGNIALTGFFEGTSQFGGDALTSAGYFDAFVATYDTDGIHQTSQRAGDDAEQNGLDVYLEDDGEVVVTGKFEGSLDWGGGTLASAGDFDIFLVKFGSTSDVADGPAADSGLQCGLYPSPSCDGAHIVYRLPRPGPVRLDAYDISGRLIARLVNRRQQAGEHSFHWPADAAGGGPAANGVVFIRLSAGNESRFLKFVRLP
jgi:hypothetical protein